MRLYGLVVQPNPVHLRRVPVVDQNVESRSETGEDFAPGGGFEIEGLAPLVGVQVEEQAAALPVGQVVGIGAVVAGPVADAGAFYLHHVGAHVGQQLAAVGRGYELAQLQYPQAVQEAVGHALSPAATYPASPSRCRASSSGADRKGEWPVGMVMTSAQGSAVYISRAHSGVTALSSAHSM